MDLLLFSFGEVRHVTAQDFTIGFLEKVINDMAKDGKVFSNEAQFQFDLGRELECKTGCRVLFEVLSLDKESQHGKHYTDLVIDFGNQEYIAIELKYKTGAKDEKKKPSKGYCQQLNAFVYSPLGSEDQVVVFPQGAEDEGSYLFLWDVYRLQKLTAGEIAFHLDKKPPVKGFAIILANSRKYWEGPKKSPVVWEAFSLQEDRVIPGGVELKWKEGSIQAKTKHPLVFAKDYTCKWEPYPLELRERSTDYPLKYMILEV